MCAHSVVKIISGFINSGGGAQASKGSSNSSETNKRAPPTAVVVVVELREPRSLKAIPQTDKKISDE